MPRYKLTIEYDGGPFVGWQVQGAAPSVQGALMAAIEAFCGERVKVGGAGRDRKAATGPWLNDLAFSPDWVGVT